MAAKITHISFFSKRLGVFGVTLAVLALIWATWAVSPAQADGPVFVRPGGSDTHCAGSANVDYSPAVAPACAVGSVQHALSLVDNNGILALDNGQGAILFSPSVIPPAALNDDISPAAVALTITKSDFPDPVSINTPLTYTVRIANIGDTPASSVGLLDTLSRIEIVTVNTAALTSTQGSCNASVLAFIRLVDCNLGTLNAGAVATITIVVTPTAAGTIRNHAETSSSETPLAIEVDEYTQITGTTNLSIAKTDLPDPVLTGSPLTYTLTVTNSGPHAAANVVVVDTLPGSVQFNPAASTAGCSYNSGVVTCTIGYLAGTTGTATVNLVVTPTVPSFITNTAVVTGGGTDNNLSNNIYTQTTQVLASANLSISKRDTPDPVNAGATLTYTIIVTNSGPLTATNVIFTDTLPVEVTVAAITGNIPGGCSTVANVISCTLGNMVNQQTAVITLQVSVAVTTYGTILNTAVVTSSTPDPNPANNSAAITTTVTSVGSITISKTAQPPSGSFIPPGSLSLITYTVRLTNSGTTTVTQIAIFDMLDPTKVSLVYSTTVPPASTIGANPVLLSAQWDVLSPGSSVSWVIGVVVTNTLVTGTIISNQAAGNSPNAVTPVNSQWVTHIIGSPGSNTVYLPIIYKDFTNPSITMYWDGLEPVRDKVSDLDGGPGLVTDGKNDGLFKVTLNLGSTGPKTVASVTLTSSQNVAWDTTPSNAVPVLGIFNGGVRLNNNNGSLTQTINGLLIVTLYAADDPAEDRFEPATYLYRVTIFFTDGSSLSAEATIPPISPSPTPTPPPPPPPACAPQFITNVSVGNNPRGVAVDTARNRVYVANFGSSSVSVINGATNAVIQTITGITSANGIAYDPTNDLIWVTNFSIDKVTPINAGTFAVQSPLNVGDGPWGIAHNSLNNQLYVVNSLDNSVTVLNASTKGLVTTLSGGNFSSPHHLAVHTGNGKVYVANFGNGSVTVINNASVNSVVSLFDSSQPYGLTVDETRDLTYVSTVDSHRIVAINTSSDTFLGWAAFHRGFNNPARPVPLRAIAINPDIGPSGDGGHLWTTTSTNDGSEQNQALLIPKGWPAYFHLPIARNIGSNPGEGVAVNRSTDKVYVSSGAMVTVLGDLPTTCLEPFSEEDSFGFDLYVAP